MCQLVSLHYTLLVFHKYRANMFYTDKMAAISDTHIKLYNVDKVSKSEVAVSVTFPCLYVFKFHRRIVLLITISSSLRPCEFSTKFILPAFLLA